MDVGGWLRSLGLGEYEEKFRDNKIEPDVLPDLTADDLKDIGVSAVGDRRRLLGAIAALTCATPPANAPATLLKFESSEAPDVSAERRPLTIMFCDLVGSTALASRLDAEDWRSLVNAYLEEASSAVTSFGGHVLQKLGDGLMALFGYPIAQENDAERAVRAALAIQRALGELNARNADDGVPELAARIGLDSGLVVVDATGEVALAEPGAVVLTGAVQRQTAGLFVAEDRGTHQLKGVPAPVRLYRIVRASGGGRRRGARAITRKAMMSCPTNKSPAPENQTNRLLLKKSDAKAPMSGARKATIPGTMTSHGPMTRANARVRDCEIIKPPRGMVMF